MPNLGMRSRFTPSSAISQFPVLGGTSAVRWGQLAAAVVPVVLLVLTVGMLVIGGGYGESGFLVAVIGATLIDVIALIGFSMLSALRERAERKHGYATVRDKENLLEVDVGASCVIRLPGERPLKLDERRVRVDAINQALDMMPGVSSG